MSNDDRRDFSGYRASDPLDVCCTGSVGPLDMDIDSEDVEFGQKVETVWRIE